MSKHRLFLWTRAPTLPDHQLIVFALAEDDPSVSCIPVRTRFGPDLRARRYGSGKVVFATPPRRVSRPFRFPIRPTPAGGDCRGGAGVGPVAEQLAEPAGVDADGGARIPRLAQRSLATLPDPATVDDRGIGTVRYPRLVPADEQCGKHLKKRTLTNLYNERPMWLQLAHRRLDEAVCAAYGWDLSLSDDDLLASSAETSTSSGLAARLESCSVARGRGGTFGPFARRGFIVYPVFRALPPQLTRSLMNARIMLWVLAVFVSPWLSTVRADGPALPADWQAAWSSPSMADRPLQIVHGIPADRATPEGMKFYKDRGLGGIVCNVAFADYLRSEENWKTLVAGVEACRDLGMVVWIYDEEGYPSGAAGGLVLAENRELRGAGTGLRSARGPIRSSFGPPTNSPTPATTSTRPGGTPNLIDDRAMRCFIEKTHDAYWQRLEPHFGRTIQAMFTDEPSLMAVNLGQLPEEVRKKVRVVDPLDPTVRPLPSVPWGYDLAEQYRQRFGEDLLPQRPSLFDGDTPEDRRVRRQFWSLIADLIAERYFGAIRTWCAEHRVASSGHSLWEEDAAAPRAAGGQRPEGARPDGHPRPGHAHVGPGGGDPQRLADGRAAQFRRRCFTAAAA